MLQECQEIRGIPHHVRIITDVSRRLTIGRLQKGLWLQDALESDDLHAADAVPLAIADLQS